MTMSAPSSTSSATSRNASMTVAHVFAQTDVGDCNKLWAFCLDGAERFLHHTALRVSAAGLLIFRFWNPKEQNGLKTEILSAPCFVNNLLPRKLKNTRHT